MTATHNLLIKQSQMNILFSYNHNSSKIPLSCDMFANVQNLTRFGVISYVISLVRSIV